MMYAIFNGNDKSLPVKGGKGKCRCCGAEVIAKCGAVNVHHWSHVSKVDCDPWKENERQWHIDWKNKFPKVYQEVIVGRHRADVKLNNLVIEFQHSPISVVDVEKREKYWKDIIWVVNLKGKNHVECHEYDDNKKYILWKYSYKWIRKSVGALLLDTDYGLFNVMIKRKDSPMRLLGYIISEDSFMYKLKTGKEFKTFEEKNNES